MSNGIAQHQSWWSRPAGGREVLQIAVPMVVTTLSWTLMNFIDSAILMQVSETAMAAAYLAGIIWFAAISLLWGLCSYGSTFVAQYFGDGQPRKIGPVVWQGVWLALSFTLVVPLARAVAPEFSRPMLRGAGDARGPVAGVFLQRPRQDVGCDDRRFLRGPGELAAGVRAGAGMVGHRVLGRLRGGVGHGDRPVVAVRDLCVARAAAGESRGV